MIEIGQESEFEMSYNEALMYCFCLGDGWRLPTKEEYFDHAEFRDAWYKDDPLKNRIDEVYVIPVRDLKDD